MAGNAPLREPIGIIDKQAGVVRLNPVWERYFTRTLQPAVDAVSEPESGDFESILLDSGDGDKINNLEKLLLSPLSCPPAVKKRGRVVTVTSAYTVLPDDETIICDSPVSFAVTLPDGVIGYIFTVKNIGAGTIKLYGYDTDTDTIDDETMQEIFQYDACKVECVAANEWSII